MHYKKFKFHLTTSGFTLIELMIAIAVIAILAAIGMPTYQGYVQKAAMTDMLQAISSYKTEEEISSFYQGKLTKCNIVRERIAETKTTK